MQEKFIENLNKASSMLKAADHMLYMTYPLVKDKRLLLKIMNEIHEVVLNTVNSILQFEYYNKNINLYKNARENFAVFRSRCAPRYNIQSEQIVKIMEIFELAEKHKQSPFEFVRNDKVVIMSNAIHTEVITIEKMKDFLFLAKDLLKKAEAVIKS